jgi:lysine 2,3-aminomutase
MSKTPFLSKRASVFADVPDEKWFSWRWQLSNRINAPEEFEQVITLSDSERKALSASHLFRVDITPYFVSLIDPDDPDDPIRQQVIPTATELVPFTSMMEDSLAEDRHSPVPGLVHRYPDRVLMLVTTQCASYCRYCTRSRIVGDPSQTFSRTEFEMQIEYLKRTPQVRDVLLSGGDPLVLAPRILEEILIRLREIPHIEIIRIGSRVPVFLPMRITDKLTDKSCLQVSMTTSTSNVNWSMIWYVCVFVRIISTNVTWLKAPGISVPRSGKELKSWKVCVATPLVMRSTNILSMPQVVAEKYRSHLTMSSVCQTIK